MVITSSSVDSNPQIYLGASIAASAQAAVQSDCPEINSTGCLSSIQSALNPGNVVVIQARSVLLAITGAALVALLSIIIEYFKISAANVPAQVIELQPSAYSSLANAQYNASVVFVTASDDSFPVTLPMGGAGVISGTTSTTGGAATTTGASVTATG